MREIELNRKKNNQIFKDSFILFSSDSNQFIIHNKALFLITCLGIDWNDCPLKLHDKDKGLSPIAWHSNVEFCPAITE